MAILNQKRILNLIPKVSAPVTIHVSQGDVGTEIEFTLVKGDELFVNPGNVSASVHGVREDGANFGAFTCTLSGSKVTFLLHSEMTAVKGSAIAEIVLVDNGGNKVGSANFGILVEESVFPLGVTYDNDVSVYESILAYVQTIPAQIEADITAAVAQEAAIRAAADATFNASLETTNSNLANEISSRANADNLINTRIDEIVAPTGEAPSAAEVTDARIGEDGTTYSSLGESIRNQIQKALSRTSAYWGISTDPIGTSEIVYNYDTKVISFPAGFIYRRGHGSARTSQSINVSSILTNKACVFFVDNSSGAIYAKPWTQIANNKNDEFIGYIYDAHVHINGVPQSLIRVRDNTGARVGSVEQKGAYIGINNDVLITYDIENKTLQIPGGTFYVYRGIGHATPNGGYLIDFSEVIANQAALIEMKADGTIYPLQWNGTRPQSADDELLGYVYRDRVYINGVSNEQIRIIGDDYNKFVYCFGDSITAGVGTSKAYHMYFHDWLPICRFKNYGIGSTGYLTETSDNVRKGNGVEGIGTASQESGNNTVLDVMQSVEDDMPAIIISAGTNDYGSSKTAVAFRTEVQNTLDYAQTKTPYVFVMTPIKRMWGSGNWNQPNSAGLYLKDYCDIIIEECEARGITYSVGYDVSLDPLNTVCKTEFMPDGLHPNYKGHMRMARNFFERMREAVGA